MKIYEFNGFPNPARVRIALKEKGLLDNVEFIQVNVPEGEHRTPEFLKKNPSGAVPVLELEDGTFISESNAITEYLDHLTGETTLTGATAKQRAIISMLNRKVEAGLLEGIGAFFHHATDGLGPVLETYQNKEWGEKQKERALETLRWMETVLEGQDYLAGDKISVADITARAGFLFAGFVGIDIPEDCPNVKAYANRLSDRTDAALAA
ncbi:glutathione S-transferase [Sneathiella sp. P13V-1]|uniref:glutathione S-transferase family protein n=1 Tax=Sneathiella sp. P13V-1 TaxID=2697366 RepID=UPI00187B748D|nr:glutathione S-transferase family protein [Sneathiella sp. P13V-1]MBE7638288.1 glutathione S-transferase [Sneathiella sp. P13V-1]